MAFTSEDREFNTMLTTSSSEYMKGVTDNIGKANMLIHSLNQDGFKRIQVGGERIEVPLRITKSTSGGWFENYDLLNTTPAEPLTKAWFDWKQLHYSVVVSGLELRKNAGPGKLADLMTVLFDDAEDSLTEDLNDATFGAPTSSTPKVANGLQLLVPEDPTDATAGRGADGKIGAIAQGDESWWRSQIQGNGGTSVTWLADTDLPATATAWVYLELLYENCSKGGGPRKKRAPNIGMANQCFFSNYLSGLSPQRRFQDSKMANAGFKNIMFNDLPISWDETCASASSSSSVACLYMLNTSFMHLVVESKRDFMKTPFVTPANQDAKICQIHWMGNLAVSSRRKHGLFVDADK